MSINITVYRDTLTIKRALPVMENFSQQYTCVSHPDCNETFCDYPIFTYFDIARIGEQPTYAGIAIPLQSGQLVDN